MKDVTDLLHSLPSVGQTLEGFLFFVAPRIDFRQSASRVGDCLSGEGVEDCLSVEGGECLSVEGGDCLSVEGGDCLSGEGVRCVRLEAGQ